MKVLMLDNYDSFTYNLVHLLKECGATVEVHRNDKISLEEVGSHRKIVLSPGPGIPSEAGIMLDLIRTYAPNHSILGVCLGHQGIGEIFGGVLAQAPEIVHGKASEITILKQSEPLFAGLDGRFNAGRYHSWIVKREMLPECLEVTAVDESGNIMGLSHKHHDVRGVQFHPESVLTKFGKEMIQNWLRL